MHQMLDLLVTYLKICMLHVMPNILVNTWRIHRTKLTIMNLNVASVFSSDDWSDYQCFDVSLRYFKLKKMMSFFLFFFK